MTGVSQVALQPFTSTSQSHLEANPQLPDRMMENQMLHLSKSVHLLLLFQWKLLDFR